MNHERLPTANPEHEHHTTPAIYIASLADYNNGRLHGEWIDATIGAEAIHQHIQALLARSKEPAPEEWAIHDYEGFGAKTLGEYEQIEDVAALAEGIEQHGDAFAAWVDFTGFKPTEWHLFTDAYLGRFSSLEAYAEQIIEELGWSAEVNRLIPQALSPYIRVDATAMATDLKLSGEIFTVECADGVHVFSNRT
ncbi:antirestriction protein ArdA [Paenarthrobacter nicotinovorans]|uniref:antirestriction protein ArdA n=1 Tax=Paenarthrobacter nicotinovorans TaxID=29320 RepID=UPI003D665D83